MLLIQQVLLQLIIALNSSLVKVTFIYLVVGGFGEVRLCEHKSTGETRAVKIMKKNAMSQKSLQWLKNEIEILKTLDHPHIVRLYEVFEDESRYFLVQE